uniref:Uncharacterized protein n=1 Tax=Nelumbo nucifera TaxID=4432 RepID=A0A822XGJ9_NELNU|nr:TPA_asm: hypothetical protein HUJ06_019694 [Nelumbo nucifera]
MGESMGSSLQAPGIANTRNSVILLEEWQLQRDSSKFANSGDRNLQIG